MARSWLLLPLCVLAVASASCPAPPDLQVAIDRRLAAYPALRPLISAVGLDPKHEGAPSVASSADEMLIGADLANLPPTGRATPTGEVLAAVSLSEPDAPSSDGQEREWGFGGQDDATDEADGTSDEAPQE